MRDKRSGERKKRWNKLKGMRMKMSRSKRGRGGGEGHYGAVRRHLSFCDLKNLEKFIYVKHTKIMNMTKRSCSLGQNQE